MNEWRKGLCENGKASGCSYPFGPIGCGGWPTKIVTVDRPPSHNTGEHVVIGGQQLNSVFAGLARDASMKLCFACPNCSQKISAATDSGGLAVECPNCAKPSVVPTTIVRASQIADRIGNMLIKQDYVPGTTFMRLSTTGASTRMEAICALCIVTAEAFQATFRHPAISDARRQLFDKFATGAGGTAFHLSANLVPDSELGLISRLYSSDTLGDIRRNEALSDDEKMQRMQQKLEFSQEERRLQALVRSDAAWKQLETMESFIDFLKTLNLAGEDYWPIVYRRIGLARPLSEVPDEPVAQPQPKKPWWQRVFG